MDNALSQVGLLVKCRKCLKESRVAPGTDYNGWFKSKIFTTWRLRWYCPEHYEIGENVDKKAFVNIGAPEPIEPNPNWGTSGLEEVDGLEELLNLV